MNKLIVCGDSWMSPSTIVPKTHFSELLADYLGYDLIAYSRGGMSNGGIAIQISTAIKNKPDYILVGTTNYDRIELPIEDSVKDTGYKKNFSVEDIEYNSSKSLSCPYDWENKNPTLISTNLNEILNSHLRSLSSCADPIGKKEAIDTWFKHMYYPAWKLQTDMWMMYAMLHQLHLSGIPYLICFDPLHVSSICPWLDPLAIRLTDNILSTVITNEKYKTKEYVYHTSVETQEQITKLLINYICTNSP